MSAVPGTLQDAAGSHDVAAIYKEWARQYADDKDKGRFTQVRAVCIK